MAVAADTNWPSFRGLYENGVADGDAPLTWSETENVKWKLDLPGNCEGRIILFWPIAEGPDRTWGARIELGSVFSVTSQGSAQLRCWT